ncbi:unnamed protein product [Diamesa hyperborea]
MKLLLIVVCVTLIGCEVYGKSVSNDMIERMMMDEVIKISHEEADDTKVVQVNGEKTDSQKFFDSINANDRENFIIYYLEKGLEKQLEASGRALLKKAVEVVEEEFEKFENLENEPENFSTDLLNYTKTEFKMKDSDVNELVKQKRVCLGSGKCYSPSDVGTNCCIF